MSHPSDVHPRPNSLYWAFSVVVATVSLRLGIVLMSERIKTRFPDPKARIRIYALNSFLVGLGLASINVFSAPAITPEQAGILAVVATGLNSVAIVSMASSPMAYLCYMVPNVGSLVLMLALVPASLAGPL